MEIGPKSWRPAPFAIGKIYRVLRAFSAYGTYQHNMNPGDIVTYCGESWSRYDGCTFYFFSQAEMSPFPPWNQELDTDEGLFFSRPDLAHLRACRIGDDDDLKILQTYFESL